MRAIENGVPRKIFGPKRNEMIGDWRILHNLQHTYCTSVIIIMIKPIFICARRGESRNSHIMVGKPEGKRRPENWAQMGVEYSHRNSGNRV